MENWTHEMRRDFRWPNIMISAASGLVERDDTHCTIPAYSGLLRAAIAQESFTHLPHNPLVEETIQVEGCLYLAFADKIFDLGIVKDRGQGVIFLARALLEARLEQSEEKALAVASRYANLDFDREVFAKTAEVERDVISTRLVEKIVKSIQK